jgi:hypothetical protein
LQEIAGAKGVVGKTWLTIGDNGVMPSHVASNGVTVPIKENFTAGNSSAPWPGHWSLPAQERLNCRCTQIGAFAE